MVLLSDFLKCFDEQVFCSDVLKRLHLYYEGEKGSIVVPIDFVGFTRVLIDSIEDGKFVDGKFVYLFRVRGVPSSYLINYDFSELLDSSFLYCRPKRAWRDWFNDSLLPH